MTNIGKPFDVLQESYPPYAHATAQLQQLLSMHRLGWSDDLDHLPDDVQEEIRRRSV